MNVLVVNCGSSSLKYQLLDMNTKEVMAAGLVERIGLPGSVLNHRPAGKEKTVITAEVPDHHVGIQLVLDALVDKEYGVISSLEEIHAIGHRVLHAAEKFTDPVLINEDVLQAVEECIEFGPLHNPANLAGIRACSEYMPNVPQVGVFDTAFHQSMPAKSYIYALPYVAYEKYGIRRYGFHGTSHKYVSQRTAEFLGKPIEQLKLITCHLGNGASVAAVKYGKVIDTSMGLTPLEGLVMGTRCGDIDPEIVIFLMHKMHMDSNQTKDFLNKKSGVLGISGISSDFRDIMQAAAEGNYRAQLAMDVFAHRVKKYIGSYIAVMNGVDAVVFTAGLGENSPMMRQLICDDLSFLGMKVDNEKNQVCGKEIDISAADATTRVLVIPTNEELMIALDTYNVINADLGKVING